MRPPGPRFEFAPVDALLTARFGARRATLRDARGCWTDADAGRLFGVSHEVVAKWRERGLSERQADEIATRLERHPCELWLDYEERVLAWDREREERRRREATRKHRRVECAA